VTGRVRVAISQRVDRWPGRNEVRDAMDQALGRWVQEVGGLPMPVPNSLTDANLTHWLEATAPQAVVLSGGNDIGDEPMRDGAEAKLLVHASRSGLPVLGICRGMQMLTIYAGGSLEPLVGHAGVRHPLYAREGEGPWPEEVNSFHNHGVRAPPPGYIVAAEAPDGTVEAMRHLTLPWEGWMWHPERETPFAAVDCQRLIDLFAQAPIGAVRASS